METIQTPATTDPIDSESRTMRTFVFQDGESHKFWNVEI
ncbi:hypothetical protein GobsT_27380 [Gemmata obscuriglobus]|nr:hypothetical protein GobsT_27380 [Gemmata obscuriglobus]VTS05466.1 unnamed protein product [Gemmata obscuriglobus UQM 2246]